MGRRAAEEPNILEKIGFDTYDAEEIYVGLALQGLLTANNYLPDVTRRKLAKGGRKGHGENKQREQEEEEEEEEGKKEEEEVEEEEEEFNYELEGKKYNDEWDVFYDGCTGTSFYVNR